MALRGEGERALKIGVTSSFMGGMISLVVLALFTPILAGWAIKFSAVEKFLIILFALTVIAALSRGQMLRGLWIGMLGVLVAMMNQFSVNNEYRMVPEFLESQMQSGFQLFPVLIGLFAVSEMLQQCETGMHASYSKDDTLEVKNNVKFSLLHDFKGQIINVFRSALLGSFSLGPVAGIFISLIKNVLHILIKGTTSGGVGELCNFLLGAVFSCVAGSLYLRRKSRKSAILGAVIGAAIMGVLSVPLNYYVTYPMYTKFMPIDEILRLYQVIRPSTNSLLECLVVFNMPFTFLKGMLDAVICFLIYKPLSPILHGKKP